MYLSQIADMLEKKGSNAPENDNFTGSFIHLELRRVYMEDYMKVADIKLQDS